MPSKKAAKPRTRRRILKADDDDAEITPVVSEPPVVPIARRPSTRNRRSTSGKAAVALTAAVAEDDDDDDEDYEDVVVDAAQVDADEQEEPPRKSARAAPPPRVGSPAPAPSATGSAARSRKAVHDDDDDDEGEPPELTSPSKTTPKSSRRPAMTRPLATALAPDRDTLFGLSAANASAHRSSMPSAGTKRSHEEALGLADVVQALEEGAYDEEAPAPIPGMGADVGMTSPSTSVGTRKKSAQVEEDEDDMGVFRRARKDNRTGVLASPLLNVIVDGHPLISREQLMHIKGQVAQFRGKRAYRSWTSVEKNMIIEGLDHPALQDDEVRKSKWEFIQVLGWNAAFGVNFRNTVDIRNCAERMVAAGEMPAHIVARLADPANVVDRHIVRKRGNKKMLESLSVYHKRSMDERAGKLLSKFGLAESADAAMQDMTEGMELTSAGLEDADGLEATALFEEEEVPARAPAPARRPKTSLAPGEVAGLSTRICTVTCVRDHSHISRMAAPGGGHVAKFTTTSDRPLREVMLNALRFSFPDHAVTDGSITYDDDVGDSVTFTLSRVSAVDVRTLADVHFPAISTVTVKATAIEGVATDAPQFEALLLGK